MDTLTYRADCDPSADDQRFNDLVRQMVDDHVLLRRGLALGSLSLLVIAGGALAADQLAPKAAMWLVAVTSMVPFGIALLSAARLPARIVRPLVAGACATSIAVLALLVGDPQIARSVLFPAALLVAPGAAAMAWCRRLTAWELIAGILPTGLALGAGLSAGMLAASIYTPLHLAGALVVCGAIAALGALRSVARLSSGLPASPPIGVVSRRWVAGVGVSTTVSTLAWAGAVAGLDTDRLHDWGLIAEVGPLWWLGFLICGAAAVVAVTSTDAPSWARAMPVLSVAWFLVATPAAAYSAPRFDWTYKHIGVARYLVEHHAPDTAVDIYHSWPAFFGLQGAVAEASDAPYLLGLASWWPVLITGASVLLVRCLACRLSGSDRMGWAAALIFTVGNWVGQEYFAPQSMGLLLSLFFWWWVITRHMPSRELWRPARFGLRASSEWSGVSRTDAAVTVGLFAIIVVTHQLTPYLILPGLAAAVVLLGVRPRWLPVACAGIAAGYLALRWGVVSDHGVGDTTARGANFQPPSRVAGPQLGELETRMAKLSWGLSAVVVVLAVLGLRPAIRSSRMLGLALAALAVLPSLALLGVAYGNEGLLRVYLFGLPWLGVLGAFALCGRGWRTFTVASIACVGVAIILSPIVGMGKDLGYAVARGDVSASIFVELAKTPDTRVIVAGPRGFPGRITDRYPDLWLHYLNRTVPLVDERNRFQPVAGAEALADSAAALGRPTLLVFGPTSVNRSRFYGAFTESELAGLRRAVLADRRWVQIFSEDSTVVLQWRG